MRFFQRKSLIYFFISLGIILLVLLALFWASRVVSVLEFLFIGPLFLLFYISQSCQAELWLIICGITLFVSDFVIFTAWLHQWVLKNKEKELNWKQIFWRSLLIQFLSLNIGLVVTTAFYMLSGFLPFIPNEWCGT